MKRRSLLVLSALVLLLASCNNKSGGNSGLMVPKDAMVVVHINTPSLSSKLSWDEIRQTNWFREMSKENKDTTAQQLLANPASSGVDTKAALIYYIKKHGRGSYGILAGSLADAGAFEKFALKANEGAEAKKEGDFSYINAHDGSVVWNKSHFVYATGTNVPDMSDMVGNKERLFKNDEPGSGFEPDSLKAFGIEALTVKNSDNLDSDDRFASLLKDGSDIHLWLNLGRYYSGMAGMMPMVQTNDLFEGNLTTVSLNFENGKINAKSKTYLGDKLSKLMANYKAEPVSAAVINRIPSSNVLGVVAFNYSPGIIKDFLKVVGMSEMADMLLAQFDFSIDDFIKANKGEVLLSFSDPVIEKKKDAADHTKGGMDTAHNMKPDVKVLFATSVNDKAAFEKMVTIIWDLSKKMKEGGKGKNMPDINYKLENNWFAASNSPELTDKFLAGGDSKLPFVDKITGHPVGVYIDLQKIMGLMLFSHGDSSKASMAALNIWEDIVVTGGEYKDKAIQFDCEVNMLDKNTNSLKQLNQYFDSHLKMKKERMAVIRKINLEEIPPAEAPKSN